MAEERTQRRLAAILAADVVSYSRLMGDDETATLIALNRHRTEFIHPTVAEYRGRIVKLMGDGALVEFPSVVDAVECAVAVQRGMKERNADVPDNKRIAFRIGINLGDIIIEGDDIYGDGVNVAARLEGLADAGGVCISDVVHQSVIGKLDLAFDDLGEQKVKNIAKPVRVYRVQPEAEGRPEMPLRRVPRRWLSVIAGIVVVAAALIAGGLYVWMERTQPAPLDEATMPSAATEVVAKSPFEPTPALPDKPSIAVLPFDNLSGDPEQEYFADGMAEDVITDLSKLPALFVIARNSSFQYKGQAIDVKRIGSELGVRYVLEGSVRRVGDQVRINAQLIDTQTGGHLWADRYDGGISDIFALQDKITGEIVSQLSITLTPDQQNRREQRSTDNADAHDAYLRGSQLYRHYTPENFAKAIPHLEQAVELDPDYGSAWAALASIYWVAYQRGFSWSRIVNPDKYIRISWQSARYKAQRHLKQAMRNPTPLAHQIESQLSWEYRQFDRALEEAGQAIALDPNDPAGHLAMAWALIYAGRAEAAIAATETVLRLDPNSPGSHLFALGTAQLMLERYDAAETTLKRALAFSPEDWNILAPLTIAYTRTGKQEDAKATLRKYTTDARVTWGKKIETYMTWWPFKREADIHLFGGGLIKAGLCCEASFEEYISHLRKGGTLE